MKPGPRNKIFAFVGLVVAIVAAFLIAAYVSDNKAVDHMQYGNQIIQNHLG